MRRILLLAVAAIAGLASPAWGDVVVEIGESGNLVPSISVTIDSVHVAGTGMLPLGADFDLVQVDIEFATSASFSGEITLFDGTFPPPGPTTIVDGGPLFWFFELTGPSPPASFIISDADPVKDFGGGLAGPLVFDLPESAISSIFASANALFDASLPNFGYYHDLSEGGIFFDFFAGFSLGTDLNGDEANDSITFELMELQFSDPGAIDAGSEFVELGPALTGIILGSVNPPFNLTELTVLEFSGTQEIVFPAIPEPSTLVLLVAGGVLALTLRRRRST